MSKFILRDEYFGSTIYNREKLNFKFLNKEDTELLKKGNKIDDNFISDFSSIDFRNADIENIPRGMLYSPVRIYFEITRKCGLHCKNCFSVSGKSFSDELGLENVINILNGLKEDNVIEVRITGGEPTDRKDWEEILKYTKDLDFVLSFNTNGAYNDLSKIDSILKIAPDQVIISLDGLKESHELMRGKGNYEKTKETLKQLSSGKINLRINTILNKHTINEIEPMVDIASEYSSEICFILLRPMGSGADIYNEIPSIFELNEAVRKIADLKIKYKTTKIMTSYDVISQNSIKPAEDLDLTSCAAGLRGCNIDSRGDIYACGFLAEINNEYKLGNIVTEEFSILNIWRNSKSLQEFRKRSLEKTSECKSCNDYKSNCFGSCVVMDYAKPNLLKKNPYCFHDL